MVQVIVGRFDNNKIVDVAEGTPISTAFSLSGLPGRTDNEVIQDLEGNSYDGVEEVTAGKTYLLVQRVKSGN